FFDAHICAVFDEALSANAHTAILAFQFKPLQEEVCATKLAALRPNLSVYAPDGAVIFGVQGKWRPGESPSDEWLKIRRTYWDGAHNEGEGRFLLGDFAKLARFFAHSQSSEFTYLNEMQAPDPAPKGSAEVAEAQDNVNA